MYIVKNLNVFHSKLHLELLSLLMRAFGDLYALFAINSSTMRPFEVDDKFASVFYGRSFPQAKLVELSSM